MKRLALLAVAALLVLPATAFAHDRHYRPPIYPPPYHLGHGAPAGTCYLSAPNNPLTPQGLATPYQLSGPGCTEANIDDTAFVQAAIIAPNGTIGIYSPLVLTAGTKPAMAPVVPVIAAGSTVALWTGFNNIDLHLTGPGASQFVNGLPGSDFGQYAYTRTAPAWYAAANRAIRAGTLHVPSIGTTTAGAACPTVDSYQLVDQDPADNVQTTYLAGPDGTTAQNTAANRALLPDDVVLGNPSDNALLTNYVDPALGCTPWTAPNLADPGSSVPALALDQLQATLQQAQPVADTELSDEMTLVGNRQSLLKTDAYRAGVDQPFTGNGLTEKSYCTGLYNVFPPFLSTNAAAFQEVASPDGTGSLYDFLHARFIGTWTMALPAPNVVPGCSAVTGIPDPEGP